MFFLNVGKVKVLAVAWSQNICHSAHPQSVRPILSAFISSTPCDGVSTSMSTARRTPALSRFLRSVASCRISRMSDISGARSLVAIAATDKPLSARVSRPDLVREAAFINGKFLTTSPSDKMFEVLDPASGAVLGRVQDMDAAASAAAIDAAVSAFSVWRSVPAKDRGVALRRWYDLIIANTNDLAIIMTSECGKPLAEAKGEVAYAASFVDFYAEEARRIEGCIITPPGATKRVLTMKQAVGPAAFITPWNFPAAMITRKAAPAIAAGCPVVALPAPSTPFTALALAHLSLEAGLPPGAASLRASCYLLKSSLRACCCLLKSSFRACFCLFKSMLCRCAASLRACCVPELC